MRRTRSIIDLLLASAVVSTTMCLLPLRWVGAQQPTKATGNANLLGGDTSPPVVTITPAPGIEGVTPLPVTILFCDNSSLVPSSAHVVLDGVNVTASFTYQTITKTGCGAAGQATGTVALRTGKSDTLTASIVDVPANFGFSTAVYTYIPPVYQVTVTPKGTSSSPNPAHRDTTIFTVKNGGNGLASFSLTASCTGSAFPSGCVTTPATLSLAAGGSQQALVSDSSAGSTTTGRIKLTAQQTSPSSPSTLDTGWVTVSVPRTSSVTGTPIVAVAPSTALTQTFTLGNAGTVQYRYDLSVSCSGLGVTGCTVVDTATVLGNHTAAVTVHYTSGPSSDSGSIVLHAERETDALDTASFLTSVLAGTQVHPQVALDSTSSGATHARSLCLTMSAGADAAIQCGDLYLAHALGTVRTMNKARTPTLLYNSQFAHPHPMVSALVNLIPGAAVPDSISASLSITGGGVRATGQWPGSDFTGATQRRIAVAYDALNDSSGPYGYTLTLTAKYLSAGVQKSAATTGTLVVVNRVQSPFGAGWWLAGLERILFPTSDTTTRFWIGGDGSTRLYSKVNSTTWIAPTLDRPDTIAWDGTEYVRHLAHGVHVLFNTSGVHTATLDRLGHRTSFTYTTNKLQTIQVPTPTGGSTVTYGFTYDGTGHLQTATSPGPAGTARTTTVTITSGRTTSILDPDGTKVGFGYDSLDVNRMTSQTNRRCFRTTAPLCFPTLYRYDAGKQVASLSVATDSADTSTIRIRNADSTALASAPHAVVPDSAYVRINGPRRDTTITRVWLDRFGEPTKIVNALGFATVLTRADPAHPVLVTQDASAGTDTVRATYDASGNLATETAINPLGDGRNAVSRFSWDPVWGFVDSVVTPANEVTTFGYDATTGNRVYQQVGSSTARRVTFNYKNTLELMSSSVLPVTAHNSTTAVDSIEYDAQLGNLSAFRTPLVYWTTFATDAEGRDTLVVSPVDSSDHARGGSNSGRSQQRMQYDLADRDTLAQTVGPALNGGAQETLTVETGYDEEGNRMSISRKSTPDPKSIGSILTSWTYDGANRVTSEIAPDGKVDRYVYDPAGNVTRDTTRRGLVVAKQYDALNRNTVTNLPAVTYAAKTGLIDSIPLIKNQDHLNDGPYGPDTIAADTRIFAYDSAGRLVTADNGDAWISRTYYPSGLLKSETERVRTATGVDSTTHVYTVSSSYDLDGRRVTLLHPPQLASKINGQLADTAIFAYDTVTGQLASARDPAGNTFQFGYDERNQLATTGLVGYTSETRQYDNDGRMVLIDQEPVDTSIHVTPISTQFWVDARGLVLKAIMGGGIGDTLTAAYSGLGHLISSGDFADGRDVMTNSLFHFGSSEAFLNDALGNMYQSNSIGTESAQNGTLVEGDTALVSLADFAVGTGRLELSDHGGVTIDSALYDASGNTEFTRDVAYTTAAPAPLAERASFYDAENRLRAADYRTELNANAPVPPSKVFEQYRYDALGRRVWVNTHRTCLHSNTFLCEFSVVRRTVWDGNQELDEIQMPAMDSTPAATLENDTSVYETGVNGGTLSLDVNVFFGRVLYTNGLAVDQPLSLLRVNYVDTTSVSGPYQVWAPFTVVPQWDYRGQPVDGFFPVTSPAHQTIITHCTGSTPTHCAFISWPLGWLAYDRQFFTPLSWHGTLVEGKRDGAETLYRRNREYDPATGRFTQEDPIGLAGGINLYGFAAANPLNFSDPFGLSVCSDLRAEMEGIANGIEDRIRTYEQYYYRGEADKTHFDQIDEQRNRLKNVENRYYRQEKCDKKDEDNHDDWMNFGGGRYVELMKIVPVQDWQIDNSDNPHGPGRKRPPRDPAMSSSLKLPSANANAAAVSWATVLTAYLQYLVDEGLIMIR